jgi:hypothetical protein
MEIPCPPEQLLFEKVMFVPLLMAKQSSVHQKFRVLRQLLDTKYIKKSISTLVLDRASSNNNIICRNIEPIGIVSSR